MVDQGKLSTGIVSVLVIIFGVIIQTLLNNPAILQGLMGNYYLAYGAIVVAVLSAIYEIMNPRNKQEPVEVPVEEGA